ncbi:MAG: hypothetical protein IJW21_06275 [Clostridia bacterium]|nr:hypothetical protein [Clostridia bacterium]
MRKSKAERFLEAFNDIDDKYLEEAMNYTMKKKFNFKPIVAVAACLVLAVTAYPMAKYVGTLPGTGVTETTAPAMVDDGVKFTVYESGVHSSINLGTHNIEKRFNSVRETSVEEYKLNTQKTIYVQGKEWTAQYESTKSSTDYTEPSEKYTGISNGRSVTFIVNTVTGKCELFRYNGSRDPNEIKLTEEELYEIAYNHFMNDGYVDDPENYTFVSATDTGISGYSFGFARFVNGIQTSECAIIGIRHNGDFYYYMGNHIGEMKDADVSGIDMNKFYDAIDAKFKTIYGDAYVGCEKKGGVYTKLRDGSYIMEYSPRANVKTEEGEIVKDRCFFVITLD